MRLIDADELIYESIDSSDTARNEYYYGTGIVAIRKEDIDDAPTIDAVEVVRCKDCKWWYLDADTEMACEYTEMGQPEDGYCNWAERRSDEKY